MPPSGRCSKMGRSRRSMPTMRPRAASRPRLCEADAMTALSLLQPVDADEAWTAVLRRDRMMDGRFVTGVLTTGIYCRPSCAARHPRRENVRFFATGDEARSAGLRACLRCKPDDVARDSAAIEAALELIDSSEEPPSLEAL